jgi:NAD(P)-dependent dehydrogenase (short-subunit alcohol dehydrogenase family)
MQELDGRVAVVTGAASGIGLGMAKRFAAEGMRVVMADVERNALRAAVDDLARGGADVIAAPTDTSMFEEVEALAALTLDHFGAVHVVCNNAGVGSRGLPFRELPLRDFEWVLGVNLWGVIHGLHAFLPHLRLQDEGHIVNTASVSALYHLPNMAPYNASKAAVLALSETLKFELDAEGSHVGVSVLCPSWVRTNISTASRNLPERLAYELSTEQMAQIAEYKGRRKLQQVTAMEPDEVADRVCDAIRTNRFYVITHESSVANIQDRFDRILAGENPVEPTQ